MNIYVFVQYIFTAAAAKSPQSCLTKCDPIRRQPTSLRRPWDSPGKNTGVGCHFLLQCMKVKSESEVTQSCPTLRDPMDCTLPGSSAHGIFQARALEWGATAFFHIFISNLLCASHWSLYLIKYKYQKRICYVAPLMLIRKVPLCYGQE